MRATPKIQNLRGTFRRENDVLRFEVAMHDARGVCGGESGGDLCRDVGGLARRERALVDRSPQRFAGHQLTHDVGRVMIEPDIVNRHDVRMVE
jgi:hypothetical protein